MFIGHSSQLTISFIQGATALFEMIEYYESATHLDISGNTNLGLSIRVWEAFNRMLNKVSRFVKGSNLAAYLISIGSPHLM